MTMIDNAHAPEWHSISEGPDAESAELRRALAAAELRAMNAVSAEDTAQFAFETARLRANRFEAAFKAGLLEKIMPILPEKLENSAEALADCLVDDIGGGTAYDELDVAGYIESWLEERR